MIARANCRAVKGATAASMWPSRRCKCQSSGRVICSFDVAIVFQCILCTNVGVTVARILIIMLLLKTAPQDLPYSFGLMSRVIFLYFISGVFIQSSVVEPLVAINMMVLNIVVLLSFSYTILSMRGFKSRFVQAVSALCGIGVIFNLMAWPLTGLIGIEGPSDTMTALIAMLMLSMLSWELLVAAHIYRNALNLHMVHSVILSFALFFISIIASQIIFPETY